MKNLILSSVLVLIASSAAQAQQAVQWKVSDGGNGHWYARVNLALTWSQARISAEERGGYLVTVTSDLEWQHLKSVLPVAECWAGASQSPSAPSYAEPNGGWSWVTGEPFQLGEWMYFDDCPAGPPAGCACGGGAQDAAFFPGCCSNVLDDLQDGSAQDCTYYPGDEPDAYIIEWSADCNNDGIVDYGQILDKSLFDGDSNGVPDCCELGYDCTQNLIHNGGFESGPAQPDCGWVIVGTTSSALGPWQVIQANVDRVRLSPMCGPVESWVSYLGEYTVDLDGAVPGGTISQTIPTEAGREYRLSLQLTANCGPGAIKAISVTAGNDSAQFSTTCQSGYPQPWRSLAMTFSATGTSTTVTIRSLSSSGANGPIIDDVRVSTLEEPNACPGDITNGGTVDAADLSILLAAWGTNGQAEFDTDIDGSGLVDGGDLALVLGGWGPCPQ